MSLQFAFNNATFSDKQLYILYTSASSSSSSSADRHVSNETVLHAGIKRSVDAISGEVTFTRPITKKRKIDDDDIPSLEIDTDTTLLPQGGVLHCMIHVNYMWLTAQCSYLKDDLIQDGVTFQDNRIYINLSSVEDAKHFEACIKYIYLEELPDSNFDKLFHMLHIAQKYQFQGVFQAICNKMKTLMNDKVDFMSVFKYVCSYHELPQYKAIIVEAEKLLAAKYYHFDAKFHSDIFYQLPYHVAIILLKSDHLNVYCENNVYQAVVNWCAANQSTLTKKQCIQMFSSIRLPLCTVNFVSDIVAQDQKFGELILRFGDSDDDSDDESNQLLHQWWNKRVYDTLHWHTMCDPKRQGFMQHMDAMIANGTWESNVREMYTPRSAKFTQKELQTMHTRGWIFSQVARMPESVKTPVIYVDGYPFKMELCKSLRPDGNTYLSLFQENALQLNGDERIPVMYANFQRIFMVYNFAEGKYFGVNQTISSYNTSPQSKGCYQLLPNKITFAEAVAPSSPWVDHNGNMKIAYTISLINDSLKSNLPSTLPAPAEVLLPNTEPVVID
jgi:hypothetical protein